jgi:hypothetical protein
VSKKGDRWGSGEILEVVVGLSARCDAWIDAWCDSRCDFINGVMCRGAEIARIYRAKNSSNKFEITIVSKKGDRWGSDAIVAVVEGWSVRCDSWCDIVAVVEGLSARYDSWCDSIRGVYAPRSGDSVNFSCKK